MSGMRAKFAAMLAAVKEKESAEAAVKEKESAEGMPSLPVAASSLGLAEPSRPTPKSPQVVAPAAPAIEDGATIVSPAAKRRRIARSSSSLALPEVIVPSPPEEGLGVDAGVHPSSTLMEPREVTERAPLATEGDGPRRETVVLPGSDHGGLTPDAPERARKESTIRTVGAEEPQTGTGPELFTDEGAGVSLRLNEAGDIVDVELEVEGPGPSGGPGSVISKGGKCPSPDTREVGSPEQRVSSGEVPTGGADPGRVTMLDLEAVEPQVANVGVNPTVPVSEEGPSSVMVLPLQVASEHPPGDSARLWTAAELDAHFENFLMTKLTSKWSLAAYAKRVEESVAKSTQTSNVQGDMVKIIATMQAKNDQLLQENAALRGKITDLEEYDLTLDSKITAIMNRCKEAEASSVSLYDDHECTKRDLLSLVEELRRHKEQQMLITSCLGARASSLEDLRRLDNVARGAEDLTEKNAHKMEGIQFLAMYLANKSKLPRALMNDRGFTDLLLDKNAVLLAMSEQEAHGRRSYDHPRYVAESRDQGRDQPSSSQFSPAPEGRRTLPEKRVPETGRGSQGGRPK